MLSWINSNNEEQKKWASKYIANKTQISITKLKSEKEWIEAIERDCEYSGKETITFIKPMKAAWRKHLSREKRKRDFSTEGKKEYNFVINKKSYDKLYLLSKSKKVTMSRMIEILLEEKEVQLEIYTSS